MLPELLRQMGFETGLPERLRPRLGVSACLLGHPVRYDGGHRDNSCLRHELGPLVRFVEVCPEVAIGLPVPRPPIQVVAVDGEHRVRGVADTGQDYTEALSARAHQVDSPLDGFVFKARSPSCGLGTTPVHGPDGGVRGLSDGAFAAALAARFPALPLCNETDLEDPSCLTAFAVRLFCHHQWRHSPHPEKALNTLRRRSEGLDEPLLSGTQRFIEHLAAPAG